MKGIVFTEFLELVGRKYGSATMDSIIESAELPSRGAYTADGSYDDGELMTLARKLSEAVHLPAPELLKAFGQHLFARFSVRYPPLFDGVTSCFDFLDRIEEHVYAEIRKIYPDAELPSIDVDWRTEDRIQLFYTSTRPLAPFAEGLMRGAIAYFGETIEVRELDAAEDGTFIRFELVRS